MSGHSEYCIRNNSILSRIYWKISYLSAVIKYRLHKIEKNAVHGKKKELRLCKEQDHVKKVFFLVNLDAFIYKNN